MGKGTEALAARIRTLERRIRLLGVAISGVVLLFAVGQRNPPRPPEVLQAQRFQLLDMGGRIRAELRHDHAETGLFIMDAAGDTRLGAAQFSHGGGGYALHGPGGRGAAVLYLSGDGSLTIYDAEGDATARFPDAGD